VLAIHRILARALAVLIIVPPEPENGGSIPETPISLVYLLAKERVSTPIFRTHGRESLLGMNTSYIDLIININ
jgi:hypothetical protein